MAEYPRQEQEHIDVLARSIEDRSVPLAVVDYLGRRDADGLVTKHTPDHRRFGVRDTRHVCIYDLKVISYNARGRAEQENDRLDRYQFMTEKGD